MSSERSILEQWAKQNPGLFEGLKLAIAGAEGTILGGKPGYNVMFGGGKFNDLSRHPDKVIKSPGGYSSAAAGAYQFMPGTWQEVKSKLGLTDFGPQSQDLAMLYKVRQRSLPIGGLAAITKAGTLTPQIQAALSPEWASFPTQSGASYYGQPVKKAAEIQQFFEQGRTRAQNSAPPTVTTANAASKDSKKADLFQQMLQKSFLESAAYRSPISKLLDNQILNVLTNPVDSNISVDDFSRGLAGLGFPSLL